MQKGRNWYSFTYISYNCIRKEGYWTIKAEIISENIASLNLHKKCGFREVGYHEKLGHRQGVWHDVILLERRSLKTGGHGLLTRECL